MERFELSRAFTPLLHFECRPFNRLGTSPNDFRSCALLSFSMDGTRKAFGIAGIPCGRCKKKLVLLCHTFSDIAREKRTEQVWFLSEFLGGDVLRKTVPCAIITNCIKISCSRYKIPVKTDREEKDKIPWKAGKGLSNQGLRFVGTRITTVSPKGGKRSVQEG